MPVSGHLPSSPVASGTIPNDAKTCSSGGFCRDRSSIDAVGHEGSKTAPARARTLRKTARTGPKTRLDLKFCHQSEASSRGLAAATGAAATPRYSPLRGRAGQGRVGFGAGGRNRPKLFENFLDQLDLSNMEASQLREVLSGWQSLSASQREAVLLLIQELIRKRG